MPNPTQRGTYKPSGRVAWGKFLLLYGATLVGAAVLAGGMYWLFTAGWYLMIIVPLVAALLLALALTTVVRVGKCRSPGLAWIAGIFAGALMYVGYFYVGMVAALGIQNAGRLDLFPQYVSWRAGNDVTHEEGRPATRQENPDPFMNWVWYALELGFVLYRCGMFARRRRSRAFCEPLREVEAAGHCAISAGQRKDDSAMAGGGGDCQACGRSHVRAQRPLAAVYVGDGRALPAGPLSRTVSGLSWGVGHFVGEFGDGIPAVRRLVGQDAGSARRI